MILLNSPPQGKRVPEIPLGPLLFARSTSSAALFLFPFRWLKRGVTKGPGDQYPQYPYPDVAYFPVP